MPEVLVARCGDVPYRAAREAQKLLEQARHAGEIPDVLLLLEHPPVYTLGRRAEPAELPMGVDWYRAQGIDVVDTDRGGRVTYHGPGQLVAYPIMSLRALGGGGDRAASGSSAAGAMDIPAYVERMERAIIAALGDWGVRAQVIDGLTGVWTEGEPPPGGRARKIASIGIHVNRAITTHGLAINVNNDLQPFEWIVPCGIEAVRMTSIRAERGAPQDLSRFGSTVAARLGEAYGRRPAEVSVEELGAQVAGIEALVGREPASVGFEA